MLPHTLTHITARHTDHPSRPLLLITRQHQQYPRVYNSLHTSALPAGWPGSIFTTSKSQISVCDCLEIVRTKPSSGQYVNWWDVILCIIG